MIIIETKTSRAKLKDEVKKSQDFFHSMNSPIAGTVNYTSKAESSASNNVIKEAIKQDNDALITKEKGIIGHALIQANKVMVSVVRGHGENGDPVFFNMFGEDALDYAKVPLAQLVMPLTNYSKEDTETVINLIGRTVEVRLHQGVAKEATLLSAAKTDTLLVGGVTAGDIAEAIASGLPIGVYLEGAGFSQDQIKDFFLLKMGDIIPGKNIITVEGEGYLFKAIDEMLENEFQIKLNQLPASWIDLNKQQMKNKLCHNPITAFSAR